MKMTLCLDCQYNDGITLSFLGEGKNIYFNCVICSQHYMQNYYLYHIVNRNILFNAIVTCMNKYIIIIIMMMTYTLI